MDTSGTAARQSKSHKSRLTNGATFSRDVDLRGSWPRRVKDLINAFNVGTPKAKRVEARSQLVRRAATACATCERIESEIAAGMDVDLDLYLRTSALTMRLLDKLHIPARPALSSGEHPQPVDALEVYLAQRRVHAKRPIQRKSVNFEDADTGDD